MRNPVISGYLKKLTFVLMVVWCSCSPRIYPRFDYNESVNPWVDSFKDEVFFSALREAYKQEGIFQQIEKKDALNPYDGLSLSALDKARKLGKNLIERMPPPAMCEGCTPGQNYYMASALHYYQSFSLDSIAQAEYKKHLKEDKAAH